MSSFQSDCIFRESIYRLYTRFGVPKLYRYVYEGKWTKIPMRCRSHPREAKFVHKYAPCDTALHRLIRCPSPSECDTFLSSVDPAMQNDIAQLRVQAVRALLAANPWAASTPDCMGRTPLHLACIRVDYSKGAAEALLEACPMAALIQDDSGMTPLHCLLSEDQNVPHALLEKIVAVAPRAMDMKDRRGRTPMDIANIREERANGLMKGLQEVEHAIVMS